MILLPVTNTFKPLENDEGLGQISDSRRNLMFTEESESPESSPATKDQLEEWLRNFEERYKT